MRSACPPIMYSGMKDRGQVGVYLIKGRAKGFPLRLAKPMAWGTPESGTPADQGCCVSFESFAYRKLGYHDAHELGPREIVQITAGGWEMLSPPGEEMKNCAFLWPRRPQTGAFCPQSGRARESASSWPPDCVRPTPPPSGASAC